jgi:phosphosulfolactate synthase
MGGPAAPDGSRAPTAGRTAGYLARIGVEPVDARTSPFDPGYDPLTLRSHLEQSRHLMSVLKLSMACWIVADEAATVDKLAAARSAGVPTAAGGGPFEIAVEQGAFEEYLDLCASLGFARIEAGRGFTDMRLEPGRVVAAAAGRGLDVQFELGKKHAGAFWGDAVGRLVDQGRRWLDAGAVELIVEARESARGIGLFDEQGRLDAGAADRFVEAFGFDAVSFEAPTKPSQFQLLDHLGPRVRLCNVRLEELLRVEIYRRGLHADAFANPRLRPRAAPHARAAG